jgi:ABC-2 type transport system ATP-binding protein
MTDYAINTTKLCKKYGNNWGLKGSTFKVKRGELAVLVGPNGVGKTTTVRILTTFTKPTDGKAEVLGMDVTRDYKNIRKKIAYLPQGFEVNNNLTPTESVKWSLVAKGCSLSDAKTRSKKWMQMMGLEGCQNRVGWTLSGGEKRKVAVSMTLAADAEVVFLDEPTTGLDVEARHIIWKIIRELVSNGTTVLLTTHDMEEGETIADSAVLMNHGETVSQNTPQSLVNVLPYKYRVTIEKDGLGEVKLPEAIDLGDRLIMYTQSDEEARSLMADLSDESMILSVGKVGLEDAYLYLINNGEMPACSG